MVLIGGCNRQQLSGRIQHNGAMPLNQAFCLIGRL
jgi:hypothetical protein